MSMLTLQDNRRLCATAVPDIFLEEYMPSANGEFVKIYLYLLKSSKEHTSALSLSSMADFFFCTETDIVRALKYWEKLNLLSLSYSKGESLPTGISLLPVAPLLTQNAAEPVTARTPLPAADLPAAKTAVKDTSDAPKAAKPAPASPSLSGSRIAALQENDDIRQLLYLAEQYLGRTLSSTDIHRILYFYDELHFSAELLEYLIEYCVSKGSTSIHYVEKVGLSWHERGITTVAMARQETNTWNKNYFTILKAFGIRSRNPIPKEAEYMDRWLNTYGFSLELIREACTRTITKVGQPSFDYAEGILKRWKEKNIRTMEDVRLRDTEHKKNQKEGAKPAPRTSDPNRFNNFHQREYDYGKLEQQLLNQ